MVASRQPSGDPSVSGGGERTRRTYQRIARWYDLIDLPFEYGRYRSLRALLFRGLKGRILEAGVGTGRNIPFYPSDSEVVGVDLSPAMLERAGRRLPASPAAARLMEMDVTRLVFSDDSFDAAVGSFLLCTLPDALQVAALRELRRVVKPGGIVRLLEYAQSTSAARRALARIWQPWTRWAFSARLDRHPEEHLEEAGLVLVEARCVGSDLIRLIEARPAASGAPG